MIKVIVTVAFVLFGIAPALAGPGEDAIRHVLHSAFDKPEARLAVDPVVVVGSHAVAGWSQGEMGGRALLRGQNDKWTLILCSGDGIKSVEALRHAGVPAADATTLAQKLGEAESGVAKEQLALFAKFEGTLMMDAAGGHPAHPPMQHQAQMHPTPAHPPAAPASATPLKAGNLVIETPWLRATPRGAQVAGGYMKITNTGKDADRLTGGTLEGAGRFEVHEMTMVDNVMRMRQLSNGLTVKPGETVELKPGGYHIMGMDLQGGYTQGQTIKGTLTFEKAGTVAVEYSVGPIGGSRGGH